MELVTIGAFARLTRLTPKALRLYDELGLLTPARVDPFSGYRYYDPGQVERARLVAWLRRLGMPLARIRTVCDLGTAAAADEVRAFWDSVESDTAARRELASFLIAHLARRDQPMMGTTNGAPLTIRYAALSDTGRVRESNQDVAYAGDRLLAVADGFGARGQSASSAAVAALRRLETRTLPAGDLLNALEDAVREAEHDVRGVGPDDEESGTTLTAMLWDAARSQLALVHIGDSRAYLLRDRGLFRITHDHTHVQSQVDEGRITPEEARSHPQRALLLRALGAVATSPPDLKLHDALPGDRYLLCSDGLSGVVPDADVRRTLTEAGAPADAVRALVDMSIAAGGPDNVSCVVADVTGVTA
ncbi:MerR family transcriptional regulator [Streptomyces sp. NPDC048172]|uniref:MerR family transcriptional regulator n=1 Tax=Streptomyces sp. NPDC048172 TaxID=3365505 RepID=UPI0037167982